MRAKLYLLKVKGNKIDWHVQVKLTPDVVSDMSEDGIDISEIVAVIPMWAVKLGLEKWYAAAYQFLNFFRII